MTLTRRLQPDERDRWRFAAVAHFADALAVRRRIETISIFSQAAPGAPFLLSERIGLGAR